MTLHSERRAVYHLIKIFAQAGSCVSVDVNVLLLCITSHTCVCACVRVWVCLCLGGFVCVVALV